MTGAEFAELVEWITDRCGRSGPWLNAENFAADFAPWDAVLVWDAVNGWFSDPANANWAPNPLRVIAGARERARLLALPERQAALPEVSSGGGGGWAEWCLDTFGEVRDRDAVVRERHAAMVGKRVTEQSSRVPSDYGWLEDGVDLVIECHSPLCDVHRDVPVVMKGVA